MHENMGDRQKTHYFACDSQDEVNQWIDVFRRNLGFSNHAVLDSTSSFDAISPQPTIDSATEARELAQTRQLQALGDSTVIVRPCPADQVPEDIVLPPALPTRNIHPHQLLDDSAEDVYAIAPGVGTSSNSVNSGKYVNLGVHSEQPSSTALNNRSQMVTNLSFQGRASSVPHGHVSKLGTSPDTSGYVAAPSPSRHPSIPTAETKGMVKINYNDFTRVGAKQMASVPAVAASPKDDDDDIYQCPPASSSSQHVASSAAEDSSSDIYAGYAHFPPPKVNGPVFGNARESIVEDVYAISTTDRSVSLKRPVPPPRVQAPNNRHSTESSSGESATSSSESSSNINHQNSKSGENCQQLPPPRPAIPNRTFATFSPQNKSGVQPRSETPDFPANLLTPNLLSASVPKLDYSELPDIAPTPASPPLDKANTFGGMHSARKFAQIGHLMTPAHSNGSMANSTTEYTRLDQKRTEAANSALRQRYGNITSPKVWAPSAK